MPPREAFPRAPTGSEFVSDSLVGCPQPMPSMPGFCFCFFGHVVGSNGTASQEGSDEFPVSTNIAGVFPPQLY